MTTDTTDIANQPHVIVHVSQDGTTILPCVASSKGGGIDADYAVYSTRDEADANIHQWTARGVWYFSIPAAAIFNVETQHTFRLKA